MTSPYANVPPEKWLGITRKLVRKHPVKTNELVEIVFAAWQSIFESQLGGKGFRIGVDIFPKPQIMGFFLHELIPLELASRYPGTWRVDQYAGEKDAVYCRIKRTRSKSRLRPMRRAYSAIEVMHNRRSWRRNRRADIVSL